MNPLPPIEGIGVAVNGADLQTAIKRAGTSYQKKHGHVPTHVALPRGTDPEGVDLYGVLNLAREAGPGVVIVGRVYVRPNANEGQTTTAISNTTQLEIF